ncbi:MAG: hypothetical protein JWP87_4302 [Labilithrix sp.]|nr:hypothetical protein [Labilithrix sp.]
MRRDLRDGAPTEARDAGHSAVHMRTLLVALGLLSLATSLAVLASCDGRVSSTCFGDGTSSRQEGSFCDGEPTQPTAMPTTLPGPLPSVPAGQCAMDTYALVGNGNVCPVDTRETRTTPGTSCHAAMECPSVCCVSENGYWVPAREPSGDPDAGADAETDADADTDASVEAGQAQPAARLVYACGCGVCASPSQACATANPQAGNDP